MQELLCKVSFIYDGRLESDEQQQQDQEQEEQKEECQVKI